MQTSDQNFQIPPFPAFPSTHRYLPVGPVQEALTRVCRSIDADEAISLVIGPPGTGKSLLCVLVAQHYRETHEIVVLGQTRIENRSALFRHLLHRLGVDLHNVRDSDLEFTLVDHVCRHESQQRGMLLIVDEAQSLSPDVLEAIRMITNTMRDGLPCVFAMLCGGVKLDDLLADAAMEAFSQRVATRCYLHPMNRDETAHYLRETIRQCGANPDSTISSEAIAAIHHASHGIPRLVNQLMTHSIDCAEEADQSMIDERIVNVAWAQLQQLPGPMVEEPRLTRSDSAVEFAELDEMELIAPATNSQQVAERVQCELTDLEDIIVDGATELWIDEFDVDQASTQPTPFRSAAARIEVPQSCNYFAYDFVETSENASPDETVFGDFDHEEDIAVGTGFPARTHSTNETHVDLESALHQEIIGLNTELVDLLIDAPTHCDVDAAADAGESTILRFEEPNVPSSERTVNSRDEFTGRDDSDLLVIEDEVEIRRVDSGKRHEAKEHTYSVDFQVMMSRMRGGSKSSS
jgi:type II secretory pathway predicted ATPase ExeA